MDTTYFSSTTSECFPKEIEQLLQEAALLYHIPLSYIIPNKDMIKEETLHFFQVDHNWILAYLDGICSPGRNAAIDYAHDTHILLNEYKKALQCSDAVRMRLRNMQFERKDMQELGVYSGFLLESVLAEEYRGLEFKAYDAIKGGNQLTTLRIDSLGNNRMLGIFKGEVKRLEIGQPPEGLHYGFIKEANGTLKKTLRNLADGILDTQQIEVPQRDSELHVLDVKGIATHLSTALNTPVHAKEIALELIQNAFTAVFTME